MDVVTRWAFGKTIDNLGEENDRFMRYARKLFSPPAIRSPLVLLACN